MTVSPILATMPPSTVGSTMTLTSTFLRVAWLRAPRERGRSSSSLERHRAADLGDLVLALGRRELHEPVDDLLEARPARPDDHHGEHQRLGGGERLALEQVLDHRDLAGRAAAFGSVSASRSSSDPS